MRCITDSEYVRSVGSEVLSVGKCIERSTGTQEAFCVQAEDGIRDLVRSRGLGDVYKRQILERFTAYLRGIRLRAPSVPFLSNRSGTWITDKAVSYTHLTLPTSDLV